MVEARVEWDGDKALGEVRTALVESVVRATVFLWQAVQKTLNTPNTGRRVKRKRGKGSYTIYPNPSKPGEAPHKRTGFGQRNVLYSIDRKEVSGRVGVSANAKYMAYHEAGDRPWLLVTVQRILPELRRLFFSD